MPETSRTQLVAYAIALCAIVWLGAHYLRRESVPPQASARAEASRPGAAEHRGEPFRGGRVTVHVAGEVRHPGVYRLKQGARVQDAVESAGGATRRAFEDGLNLAGKLEDGRQVVVPRRAAGGVAAAPAAAGGVAGAPGVPDAPVDLNQATLEVLDTLDGVGPATAKKIVDYREEHGGFGSVEELGEISGIGDKRLAALREQVRV